MTAGNTNTPSISKIQNSTPAAPQAKADNGRKVIQTEIQRIKQGDTDLSQRLEKAEADKERDFLSILSDQSNLATSAQDRLIAAFSEQAVANHESRKQDIQVSAQGFISEATKLI